MSTAEVLPIGVGRVPAWWMEITPHYVLDLEEAEARARAEEQMAVYFAQMAAADDAGLLGPDGKPKLGPDGKPLAWNGRNGSWKSGSNMGVDPKLFGMDESHPDYHAVLTGAKLPPGYEEMMARYQNGTLDYGSHLHGAKYGRQAEKPEFKPEWAKKKLRSTAKGSMVRQGVYQDKPSDTMRRVGKNEQEEEESQESPEEVSAPVTPAAKEPKEQADTPDTIPETPVTPETPESPAQRPKKYQFSDYYYNASTPQPEQAPSKPQVEKDEEEEEEEEEYTEEYEDEEVEDEEDEEETGPDINDLQAILAAKQAELARLQAQLSSS